MKIDIELDREFATEKAEATRATAGIGVYSDASGCQGHLGAAAAVLVDPLETIDSIQVQVGPMNR
jgi:hypothetical protein